MEIAIDEILIDGVVDSIISKILKNLQLSDPNAAHL
jgi:hypothetical protein